MLSPLLLVMLAQEPALVELFSSEGCSSCPPAEKLLGQRSMAEAGLVALEFHVDYWNDLGWSDPFSRSEYSERQSAYAAWGGHPQVYTPQLVVDGRIAFNGADAALLEKALARVNPKEPIVVRFDRGRVVLSGAGGRPGELWLAVAESGLKTRVPRGENAGQLLQHGPVVRAFRQLGPVERAVPWSRSLSLDLDSAWRRDRLRLVAAIQDVQSGEIVALGSLGL